MLVWVYVSDWSDFVNGREVWSIKDDFTGDFDKNGMKRIIVSPIEVERDTIASAKIRKKY